MCLGHCPHLPPSSPSQFGGKGIRCCQHIAPQECRHHASSWLKEGGPVKGMFLCKAAAQTGCENSACAGLHVLKLLHLHGGNLKTRVSWERFLPLLVLVSKQIEEAVANSRSPSLPQFGRGEYGLASGCIAQPRPGCHKYSRQQWKMPAVVLSDPFSPCSNVLGVSISLGPFLSAFMLHPPACGASVAHVVFWSGCGWLSHGPPCLCWHSRLSRGKVLKRRAACSEMPVSPGKVKAFNITLNLSFFLCLSCHAALLPVSLLAQLLYLSITYFLGSADNFCQSLSTSAHTVFLLSNLYKLSLPPLSCFFFLLLTNTASPSCLSNNGQFPKGSSCLFP